MLRRPRRWLLLALLASSGCARTPAAPPRAPVVDDPRPLEATPTTNGTAPPPVRNEGAGAPPPARESVAACEGSAVDVNAIVRAHACAANGAADVASAVPTLQLSVDGVAHAGSRIAVVGTLRNATSESLVLDLVVPDHEQPNSGVMDVRVRRGATDVRTRPSAPGACVIESRDDAVGGALTGRRVRVVLAPNGEATMRQELELTGYSGVKRGGCPVFGALRPGRYSISAEVHLAGGRRAAQEIEVGVSP